MHFTHQKKKAQDGNDFKIRVFTFLIGVTLVKRSASR